MAAGQGKGVGDWARGLPPPGARKGFFVPWLLMVLLTFLSFGLGAWLLLTNLQLAVLEAPEREPPAAEESPVGDAVPEPAGVSEAAGAADQEEPWTYEVR